MIDKNKLFDLLVDGKEVKPKNPFQREIAERFTDFQLCKEFGWTQQDINKTTVEFYTDATLILSKKNAKANREYKKQQAKSKR